MNTSDRFRETFTEYLADAEVGSAKYQAFTDFYQYRQLKWSRWTELERMEKENQPLVRARQESELRITELEMALLHREISRKQTGVPGYNDAYDLVSLIVEDLAETSRGETKREHPEASEDQLVELSQPNISQILDVTYLHVLLRADLPKNTE